ncbi:hypothetical protein AABB24_006221 [Solanum stoloniferum]
MYVPAENTFLLHPIKLEGPCVSSGVIVEINGNITAPREPSRWRCYDNRCDKWIHFKHANGLTVRGNGTINGRGHKWWNVNDRLRPTALEISHSENISLTGLSFMDSPRMHIHFEKSKSARVTNITIDSPGESPNTDGIHVSGSRDVFIDYCRIGTGDDCISIVDGCSHLNISNIICGPGHGISIGSLGKHGSNDNVENIFVSDVLFVNSTNGARIKTWQGGKGHASNIVFERIWTQDSYNPIIIDQFYCDGEHCTEHDSAVQVSNVTFRHVHGTSQGEFAVKLGCSASIPCTGIVLEDIDIRSGYEDQAKAYTSNVQGIVMGLNIPQTHL